MGKDDVKEDEVEVKTDFDCDVEFKVDDIDRSEVTVETKLRGTCALDPGFVGAVLFPVGYGAVEFCFEEAGKLGDDDEDKVDTVDVSRLPDACMFRLP